MKAQRLYDMREATGFISGTDLHDWFRQLCNGDPSPSGHEEIDPVEVERLLTHAAASDALVAAACDYWRQSFYAPNTGMDDNEREWYSILQRATNANQDEDRVRDEWDYVRRYHESHAA